ncbi:MAG: hypothetical protein OXO52_21540 [Rhodospirillales bacterium]|nr:hypothetical protein [Rhodospirillales bacterium]MDE0381414.1 hypothetical protein [Rhodospirillales bacterium]
MDRAVATKFVRRDIGLGEGVLFGGERFGRPRKAMRGPTATPASDKIVPSTVMAMAV